MPKLLTHLLVAALLACGAPARAHGPQSGVSPTSCPEHGVIVTGAAPADFADMCAGAIAALRFFAAHGVHASEPVSIEVTRHIPAEAGRGAAGCYIEPQRMAFVLPYAAFRGHQRWFGVPIDRSVYRVLAAHEAAHAIAARNFLTANPSLQAKEYLAYVAAFSTMPAGLRARALRGTRAEGFDSADRLTAILYMFDPMRFGAESYLHFLRAADQTALIEAVLAGKVLTE